MNEELEKKQQEILKLLEEWLDRVKTASQIAPVVKRAYEQKVWQTKAIESMPEAATEISHDDFFTYVSDELDYWRTYLPSMPEYNEQHLYTGGTISLMSTSSTYQFVARTADLDDPETQAWAQTYKAEYIDMQRKQARIEAVRRMLARLGTERVNEFDDAVRTCEYASTGWSDKRSAGIALRNILEHFKGDLFEKAIKRPTEQKLKWEDMASRLARGGQGGQACRALLKAEQEWKSLHVRLTDVAKNLKAGALTDLGVIFTEWVDHLYAVLSLIDPELM